MKNHDFIIIFDENPIIFDGYGWILHHFAVSITILEDIDEITMKSMDILAKPINIWVFR